MRGRWANSCSQALTFHCHHGDAQSHTSFTTEYHKKKRDPPKNAPTYFHLMCSSSETDPGDAEGISGFKCWKMPL